MLCLQGHYDMVYVGKHKDFCITPKYFTQGGKPFLGAKDSSLGADNGIAIACGLTALRDCRHIECLFTNDEEIGMLGAQAIALDVQAPYVLNCDSEEISEIVCGCAGGYDIVSTLTLPALELRQDCAFYAIESQGFCGGHSGMMIHHNIPNAILQGAKVAQELIKQGALLTHFSGGEKRNSIPTGAKISLAIPKEHLHDCQKFLKTLEQFSTTSAPPQSYYFPAQPLLEALFSLDNGALLMRDGMPILSSNLGILEQEMQGREIGFCFAAMGRGNSEALLLEHLQQTKSKLEGLGLKVEVQEYYSPWEREENAFVWEIVSIYEQFGANVALKEIHAGLECGILKQKFPNKSFASIGPTIHNPHSIQETLDLESFRRFEQYLQAILKHFCAF